MSLNPVIIRLKKKRKARRKRRSRPPPLTIEQILRWCDEYHRVTGRWPKSTTQGTIPGSLGEKWRAINQNLLVGGRGLPGGSSLPRLLAEHRGVRNHLALPRLDEQRILAWADEHHARTGSWPTIVTPGTIPGSGGERWSAISQALTVGARGLPGGSSLPQLLARRRGYRHNRAAPRLTEEQVLAWADAWKAQTGRWPTRQTPGTIPDSAGETWSRIDAALKLGLRCLPGGSSLPRLLPRHRGHRNHKALPPLSEEQILEWAREHHQRTGQWPNKNTPGPIPGSQGQTWRGIAQALSRGGRGLPGGSSLAQLLVERYDYRHCHMASLLTEERILAWADAWQARTGSWPTPNTPGTIPDSEGESWSRINGALKVGCRCLPGGSSLTRLLAEHRGHRNPAALPRLNGEQILGWAREHHERTGQWPTQRTPGTIPGSKGETWNTISKALDRGRRGLPGGSSLARLLAPYRVAGQEAATGGDGQE
jgi:hypothetical protein